MPILIGSPISQTVTQGTWTGNSTPGILNSNCILRLTFPNLEIPTDAVINSVMFKMEYKVSTTSSIGQVKLYGNSTIGVTKIPIWSSTAEPTVFTEALLDSGNDWTLDELNSGTVYADVTYRRTNSTACTMTLNYVQIIVDYSMPTNNTDGFSNITSVSGVYGNGRPSKNGEGVVYCEPEIVTTGIAVDQNIDGIASIMHTSSIQSNGVKSVEKYFELWHDDVAIIKFSKNAFAIHNIYSNDQISVDGVKDTEYVVKYGFADVNLFDYVHANGQKNSHEYVDLLTVDNIELSAFKNSGVITFISQNINIDVYTKSICIIFLTNPTVKQYMEEYILNTSIEEPLINMTVDERFNDLEMEVIGLPFIGTTVKLIVEFPRDIGDLAGLTNVQCVITDSKRDVIDTITDVNVCDTPGKYWAYYTIPTTGMGDLSYAWSGQMNTNLVLLARKPINRIWQ